MSSSRRWGIYSNVRLKRFLDYLLLNVTRKKSLSQEKQYVYRWKNNKGIGQTDIVSKSIWRKRKERPYVGGVATSSRNGAPCPRDPPLFPHAARLRGIHIFNWYTSRLSEFAPLEKRVIWFVWTLWWTSLCSPWYKFVMRKVADLYR